MVRARHGTGGRAWRGSIVPGTRATAIPRPPPTPDGCTTDCETARGRRTAGWLGSGLGLGVGVGVGLGLGSGLALTLALTQPLTLTLVKS